MQSTGFWGVINEITNWVMRFAVPNVYWFLINIPFWILVLDVFINPYQIGILYYLLALIIILPILFFPSTTALFAVMRDFVLKKDPVSLTKLYFKYFKENYKSGVKSGLMLTSFWVIWALDIYYFHYVNQTLLVLVFLIMGAGLFVMTIFFFSLYVHFEMTMKEILKNSFYLTIGKPLHSLFILIVAISVLYVSLTKLLFLLLFFSGAVIAFLSFQAFYQISLKIRKD